MAELARVSSATVSRVYNDPQSVSPEKRKTVLEAAGKLGYRPNKAASTLRRSGTGTIMLLECEKPERSYYWKNLKVFNWFYADVIHGLQEVFDASMYTLKLKRVGHISDIARLRGEADGIIGFDIDRIEEAEAVASLGIPYIICHHTACFPGYNRCSTDNRKGGFLQSRFLGESGCRRTVYLTGYLESVYAHMERLEGFLESAESLGNEVLVMDNALSGENPREIGEYLAGISSRFDSIAAVNDLTLLRVLQGIPGEILGNKTLIGYDAMPVRDLVSSPFASIDPLPHEIYRQAALRIIHMLSSRDSACWEKTVDPVVVAY